MGRVPLFIPLALLVALVLIGDSFGFHHPQEPSAFGNKTICAYLLSVNEAKSTGYLAIAEIDSVNNEKVKPFKARIHIIGDNFEPIAGERLKFKTRLQKLPDKPSVPDAVDLSAGLRRQGVTASAVAVGDSILYQAKTHSLRYYCALANNAAMMRLMRSGLNDETVDILAAMLLGRSMFISSDTRSTYSAAGLSHLLALSGMHVAVITLIISLALWPLYVGRHLKSRLILTIIILFAYTAFTGFIPSVTRAVIMSAVYLIGRMLQRKSPPLNSLCLAALIILVLNPSDLYSPGFQMSFAAVLGIILFFPLIDRVDRRKHPRIYALVSYPALSISAMLLTGIISAYHFHIFPTYFLVANLIIIPLVPAVICCGLISLIFQSPFITDYCVDAINAIARLCSSLPGATIANLYPAVWQVVALSVAVTLVGLALNGKHRFMIYESLLILVGVATIIAVTPKPVYPEKEIYAISAPRYNLTITTADGQCSILTNVKARADIVEIIDLYEIILRDFMAKRNINELIVTNGQFEQRRAF